MFQNSVLSTRAQIASSMAASSRASTAAAEESASESKQQLEQQALQLATLGASIEQLKEQLRTAEADRDNWKAAAEKVESADAGLSFKDVQESADRRLAKCEAQLKEVKASQDGAVRRAAGYYTELKTLQEKYTELQTVHASKQSQLESAKVKHDMMVKDRANLNVRLESTGKANMQLQRDAKAAQVGLLVPASWQLGSQVPAFRHGSCWFLAILSSRPEPTKARHCCAFMLRTSIPEPNETCIGHPSN